MKPVFQACALASLILNMGIVSAQPYWPSMVYSAKQEIVPGVTYQFAKQTVVPQQEIHIFEVDMTKKNLELVPVFKSVGNVTGGNETTSVMGARVNGVAAINAGYYSLTNNRTNSYTEIDGQYVGGAADHATNIAEGGRSVLGFSGAHQNAAMRTKLTGATALPNPLNATTTELWNRITDGIAGRGHFTWNGTAYTVDNEGTGESHYGSRHPRTAIGYTHTNNVPEKAFLVAIDGRNTGVANGMTYDELARFMADLGAEQSVSLDGGGSTTAWVKGQGVKNTPSDGSPRAVISSWAVVQQNTMDNTVGETVASGAWTTDTSATDKYHIDHLVTDNSTGSASVTWTPDLEHDGEYRLFAWWSADAGRATAVPFTITHYRGTREVTVDQTKGGGRWNLLGSYSFAAGTAGSISVTNAGLGTVSADAVRFVRIGDMNAVEYEVVGTVFETDFETNQSANFTVSQYTAADNSVNFQYDYATFAQAGGGYPASIPAAPNSAPGGTRALRVATNLTAGVVNGITASLNATAMPTALANMRITFDAWINYNGPAGGGSGSTEFMTFGAGANPSNVAFGSSDYTSASNRPFSGFFFAMSGEGGALNDYRYYDGSGGNAIGNNTSRVNYLGKGGAEPGYFSEIFPAPDYETKGMPGKAWNTWEVLVLNGKIRLSLIKPDGSYTVMADWFTPNNGATMAGLRPALGTFDPYSSLANPAADNFVLYDNLKVQRIQAAYQTWTMY